MNTVRWLQSKRQSGGRKRILPLVAVFVLCAAVGVPSAMAALPAKRPPMLVAMGDSFTSGTGNAPSQDVNFSCRRSAASYSALVANQLGATYKNLACSGAKSPDMWGTYRNDPSQMQSLRKLALSNDVRYVVLTIGGNDVAMFDSMKARLTGQPTPQFDTAIKALPPKVSETLRWVNWMAPQAEIYILGYPDLLPRTRTELGGCFTPWVAARMDPTPWTSMMDQLNAAVSAGAKSSKISKVHYVAPPSFAGHSVCSSDTWGFRLANTLGKPEGAFHPNALGHQALATNLVKVAR